MNEETIMLSLIGVGILTYFIVLSFYNWKKKKKNEYSI